MAGVGHEIRYQDRSGVMTYKVFGDVSNENVVTLDVTLVDADGEVHGSGRLTFPLDRARTTREAISKVIRHQVETLDPAKAYDVGEKRQANPRAYEKWTEEEDTRLLGLFDEGVTPDEISRLLGRNLGALGSRLAKLGRIEDWTSYGTS